MKRDVRAVPFVAAIALGLLSCTSVVLPSSPSPAPPTVTTCQPTLAHMTPPRQALEFFANGSSEPDRAREQLKTANWYGNEAMWVILPETGEIVGRLDDKIPPYRTKPGHAEYEARRLDGTGSVTRRDIGPTAYGDGVGFQAGGPSFPTVGCWAVTYTLDGDDPLRFVVRVR